MNIRKMAMGAMNIKYPLDLIPGAAVAYSILKLSSSWSSAIMTLRRSNDNAETDVFFDSSGVISLSSLVSAGGTLGAWVGANNAMIKAWFDQSGHGNNISQATAANQPRLITSGVIITDGVLYDDVSNPDNLFITALTQGAVSAPTTYFGIGRYNKSGTAPLIWTWFDSYTAASTRYVFRFSAAPSLPFVFAFPDITSTTAAVINTTYLCSGFNTASTANFYLNGVLNTSNSGSFTSALNGCISGRAAGGSGGQFSGNAKLILVYPSQLTENQFATLNYIFRNLFGV